MLLKKMIIVFLGTLILLSSCSLADDNIELLTEQELIEAGSDVKLENELSINSRAAIIYDRTSGQVIWGKKENEKRPMASTTKIMTAIVVIENANLDEIVEVSKKAAGTGGSRLGLKTGDKISIRDLLYGLMLCSGNDAAVALAEKVGGSVEGFAEKMNKKASELKLKSTHFVTPHGLDAKQHYTTAYELAKMADYGMKNKTFANIVGTKTYTITLNGYSKNLANTNELLGYLEGVNGVKTGFTNGANRCLVTSVSRNGMNIITVVLGADTKKFRTSDSMKLIEYAYANYEIISVEEKVKARYAMWEAEQKGKIKINKAAQQKLETILDKLENPYIVISKKEEEDIKVEIDNLIYLKAPIKEGEKIGTLKVYVGKEKKLSLDIKVKEKIEKKKIADYFMQFFKKYKSYVSECLYY